MSEEVRHKKVIKRSPGYPMISLEEALEKARKLWKEDKNNKIHVDTVYQHLGYECQGGYGARVIAALKKFGLISQHKNDIVLTPQAVDIMLHEAEDEEYIQAIKATALEPDIYSKLYYEYNGVLPSDKTIAAKLIKDYKFNPKKVSGLIEKFRATIKFAGLTQQDLEEGFEKEEEQDEKNISKQLQEPRQNKMIDSTLTFNIPLADQNAATLVFAKSPITKRDLGRIKQWIDLIAEPLLVETEETKNDDPLKGL